LQKYELAGRMIGWSVELSEFGIKYDQVTVLGQFYLRATRQLGAGNTMESALWKDLKVSLYIT